MLWLIPGDERHEPGGFDSMILLVPDQWYHSVHGILIARIVSRALRQASARGAAAVGRQLHHAEWTLTADPDVMARLAMMHDCAPCLADTDKTREYMAGHPGQLVAVGQLWFTGK